MKLMTKRVFDNYYHVQITFIFPLKYNAFQFHGTGKRFGLVQGKKPKIFNNNNLDFKII